MCKVISILNQKGGVAKTTTANALSIGLANLGNKVLAIDLDPQGNLSMSFGIKFPDNEEKSISLAMLNILTNKENSIVKGDFIHSNFGVDFIIGNDDLGSIDRMLSGYKDSEYTLDYILSPLREVYDYIVIDCMPSISNLTENAMIVSNEIIIPAEPQYFSIKGIQSLLAEITRVKNRKNPRLNVVGILPTKLDNRTNISKIFLKTLHDMFNEKIKIFESIPISIKLAECAIGENIYEYDSNGNGVVAYKQFVIDYLNTRIDK